MIDVVVLGELLVDFTQSGENERGNALFELNPGGAPCNVLAMLAKLGRAVAFVGKVGQDMFGEALRAAVDRAGIDSAALFSDASVNTTLAFVQNAPNGERAFSFYRNPGADEMLKTEELPREKLANTRIFHFGSLSLTREPVRSATAAAVGLAKAGGAWCSFDPNLRPALWKSLEAAKEQMLWGCGVCDILKVSEDELAFLTGSAVVDDGVKALRENFPNVRLLLVTRGEKGSLAFSDAGEAESPALSVKAVDTTGAGDIFCGCCLNFVLDSGLSGLDAGKLLEMLHFANAAAALVVTRKGAISSIPSVDEIRQALSGWER